MAGIIADDDHFYAWRYGKYARKGDEMYLEKYNEDGSLDLFIQARPPAEEELSNWLPIPKSGPFSLTMRLYWPKQMVLEGQWDIPFVMPVD